MNKIFLFAILTGMFAASCTDHFAEYNSNPYGVSDEVLASGGNKCIYNRLLLNIL